MANTHTCKAIAFLMLLFSVSFAAKIKDVASVEGSRSNYLIGYGLVIGLKGTGDGKSALFTTRSIANMLRNMGVNVDERRITVKNVAAVVVTAKIPPYAKPGMPIDVEVSAIGDAKSLEGGTLVLTPLKGPDGEVYALAQGQVLVSGYEARGRAASQMQNIPTVGRIPNGATIERELPFRADFREVNLYLDTNSFSLAKHVQDRINAEFGTKVAQAIDSSTIKLTVPESMSPVEFLAMVEDIDIDIPSTAKVVVDGRSGLVLLGGDVRINPVSVAIGTLTVTILEKPDVSQPPPLSSGQTTSVQKTEIQVKEKESRFVELRGATVAELVNSLNKIGATPREVISILQAIKQIGALKAKLEVL